MSKLKAVLEALKTPTPESEIQYRTGNIYDKVQGKATVLSYIDARFVMDTLDSICGPENWDNHFYEVKGAMFCSITISIDGESVCKSDCGSESSIEKSKGEASGAFKRAAVMFGIGRDLYSAETYFADLEYKGTYTDKYGKVQKKWALPKGWRPDFQPTPQNFSEEHKEDIPSVDVNDDMQETGDLINNPDWRDTEVGFASGNNVGKTWKEIDEGTLAWIKGPDCKKKEWKEKANLEHEFRYGDLKPEEEAEEEIPF